MTAAVYQGSTDQRGIESLVWKSIVTQLPRELVALDPQRLGTPTAAYDLHFQEQMCWGTLAVPLSCLSGASSGGWPMLPTSIGNTGFCGGASCTVA